MRKKAKKNNEFYEVAQDNDAGFLIEKVVEVPEETNFENDESNSFFAGEVDEEETVEEKESTVNVENSDVENSKENETINEEVNEFGVTESQIKDLYNFIESSVTENYLTVNNIESETFEWPAKEDVAWNYLQNLVDNYTISMIDLDEVDSPEFINYEVDENVSLLMKAVFNGMIDWHQEYFAGPSDLNNRADFQLKLNSVYPLNEFFIENVSFSNESTVET